MRDLKMKNRQALKEGIIRFVLAVFVSAVILLPLLSQERLKIVVVPKSDKGIFWKWVHAGVKLGSVALRDVEIVWKVPKEDIASQISVVEQSIAEGVSGIVLAPFDDPLAPPVAKAMKKKIPVLIFDSAIKGTAGKDYISFVGIDNKKAGARAGEHLAQLLGGKGKVVILQGVPGQPNIMDREKGFFETMANYKGIRIIEKDAYARNTIDDAMDASLKIASKLKEADGIFCAYEQSTMGMLLALQRTGLAGKVKFIGFDTPAQAVEAIEKGEIDALVAQDPARMGYLSVKAMADYLRGKKVEPMIDAGVQIITRENLHSPEIQKLLALPVTQE
jgi:ribose transport system substrate-binding protein